MDAEKLRALEINPEARERPRSAMWIIFPCVVLVTGVAAWFAWERKRDDRRAAGDAGLKAAAASAGAKSASSNSATSPAPDTTRGEVVLTVSGYIVNRERIELSPRFMGLV